MSEVPQNPGQTETDQNKPHLSLVHGGAETVEPQGEQDTSEGFLIATLMNGSYSDEYLMGRLNDLKSHQLSRIKVGNTPPKEQSGYILDVLFNDLHITETKDHKAAIGHLKDEAAAYIKDVEDQSDSDALFELREEISTAIYETYADTNLARALQFMGRDSQFKEPAFIRANLLAGLMLIMADKKYT